MGARRGAEGKAGVVWGRGGRQAQTGVGVRVRLHSAARRAAHLCEAGTEEGLLLPALLNEVNQLPRGVRGDLGAHPFGGDRESHLDRRVLREGDRVGEHLPAEDTEGVDIAAGAVRLVANHLREGRGGRQMRRRKRAAACCTELPIWPRAPG